MPRLTLTGVDTCTRIGLERRLVDRLETLMPYVDALLVSDYRGGTLLPEVVDKLTPAGELPASGMGDPQELLASLTRALRG